MHFAFPVLYAVPSSLHPYSTWCKERYPYRHRPIPMPLTTTGLEGPNPYYYQLASFFSFETGSKHFTSIPFCYYYLKEIVPTSRFSFLWERSNEAGLNCKGSFYTYRRGGRREGPTPTTWYFKVEPLILSLPTSSQSIQINSDSHSVEMQKGKEGYSNMKSTWRDLNTWTSVNQIRR